MCVTVEALLPANIRFGPGNSDGSAERVSLTALSLIMPGRILVPRHYELSLDFNHKNGCNTHSLTKSKVHRGLKCMCTPAERSFTTARVCAKEENMNRISDQILMGEQSSLYALPSGVFAVICLSYILSTFACVPFKEQNGDPI